MTLRNLTIAFWQGSCVFTSNNSGLRILLLQIDQPSQRSHMFDARKHSSNTVRAHFQHSETKGLQIIETVILSSSNYINVPKSRPRGGETQYQSL